MPKPIIVGAVAYDPKVVTIWEAIHAFFRTRATELDYVLFSNYEAQIDALFAGAIDISWSSPVAWVRAHHRADGRALALAMRDTDLGVTSKLIARTDRRLEALRDLSGKTLALGARDSAQAALLPVHYLSREGLNEGRDYQTLRFDQDLGKHGDTAAGELAALQAVLEGRADAAALGDALWVKVVSEGKVDRAALTAFWTSPPYSHCNFTALPSLATERALAFSQTLLAMDYADPAVRPLMELEGLKKWVPGQTTGYEALEQAMRAEKRG